ncbi:MAG: RNA-binding S4 domain-containing protein [Bacillota bacterium]|nr:RNA-binding S4 domain-containing protein [Bacillota bacterium]
MTSKQRGAVKVRITGPHIKLDQFLKWAGAVPTGGHARALIEEGYVTINGEQEVRRGRKLHPGDIVSVSDQPAREGKQRQGGQVYEVTGAEGDGP